MAVVLESWGVGGHKVWKNVQESKREISRKRSKRDLGRKTLSLFDVMFSDHCGNKKPPFH